MSLILPIYMKFRNRCAFNFPLMFACPNSLDVSSWIFNFGPHISFSHGMFPRAALALQWRITCYNVVLYPFGSELTVRVYEVCTLQQETIQIWSVPSSPKLRSEIIQIGQFNLKHKLKDVLTVRLRNKNPNIQHNIQSTWEKFGNEFHFINL